MRSTFFRIPVAVLVVLGATGVAADLGQVREAWAQDATTPKAKLEHRIGILSSVGDTLKALADQPAPKDMTAKEKTVYEAHTAWLLSGAQRCAKLAARGTAALELLKSQSKSFTEVNQSFNVEYLSLQQSMQAEAQSFAISSSIMKTRHDTAKNSISNIH